MFQTDQVSAVATLPPPATPATPGYFTNGNAGAGLPPTILDADFMNMLMMELVNIVQASGLTLSKTTYNQCITSIKMLVESGATNYGIDIGAANAYAVSYTVPITALADGLRLRFKSAHANTTASTFTPNPGTIAPAPIWGGAHAVLQSGEIIANGDVELVWNSTLGTSGVWLLLESTGGATQVAPGLQSGQAVNAGQFGAVLAAIGSQKLPGGLIIQWGNATTSATTDVAVTFPTPFNFAVFQVIAGANLTTAGAMAGANTPTLTGFKLNGWTATATRAVLAASWMAVGF